MSKATCKTCGGEVPDGHRPSMFDPQGVGHPAHKMSQSFSDKLDEVLSNLTFQAVNLNNEDTSEDIESEAKEQIIKVFLDELETLGRNEYELRDWIDEQRKKLDESKQGDHK